MARLLRPAVCASTAPGAWLPTFPLPLPSGTAAAAAAAALADKDNGYWRAAAAMCDAAMPAHLPGGRSSSGHGHGHTESLPETASRLLFCLLGWVSRIPSFSALAHSDQV